MIRQLPEKFEKEFRTAFGSELFSRVISAMTEEEPIVSLRANRLKAQWAQDMRDQVPWSQGNGIYVQGERPTFGADPLWHVGAYYVQEAGSMIVSQFLREEAPEVILDLCAAPGGKSTLLRDFFTPREDLSEPLLICNEPIKDRAKILRENMLRWGCDETIVTSALPGALADSGLRADLILVDAPCSGEGMFRKDPGSIEEWSEENVELCISRQREILSSAWEMLNEGGLLIYSTCTLNRRENEDQLTWLEKQYALELLSLSSEYDDLCLLHPGVYRFMPGLTRSEGLSIFAVRKLSPSDPVKNRKQDKQRKITIPTELKGLPKAFLESGGYYNLLSPKGREILAQIEDAKGVRILSAGLPLGELKGKDFIPSEAWVSSGVFAKALPYPRLEITTDQALALLKKKPPMIEAPDKGLYLLTYRGLPLMPVKHLGNRTNSFYPKEWSIHNPRLTVQDVPNLPIQIIG